MKSWHKHDLAPDYPLVHMTFFEQAEELRKALVTYDPVGKLLDVRAHALGDG